MKQAKRMEHGHISKRGEGKYLIRWRTKDPSTRKSKQLSKTIFGDYGAAMAALANALANPNPIPEPPAPAKLTFGEYAATEWQRYTDRVWKQSTQVTQGSFVRCHILPFFGPMVLADIIPTNVSDWHAGLKAKGLSPKSRRLLHTILSRMFGYAVETLELIGRNPVKKDLAPKAQKTKKPTLTEQQMMELFKAVPVRMKAFFMTLGLTGIRSGEALGLKWSDIDFANSAVHVRRAIYRGAECTPKTEESIRSRPMARQLYEALLHHKAMATYTRPEDFVFASSTGRPFNPDILREALHAALAGMGITFTQARANSLHLFRHSSGSMIFWQSGGNVKLTQEWLGHSNSKTTMDTYVHNQTDQGQVAAQRLETAVFAPPPKPGLMH